MLNVYVLHRKDSFRYDEYVEQTIVAETEERAVELASQKYGQWEVTQLVDLDKEQVLTTDFNAG